MDGVYVLVGLVVGLVVGFGGGYGVREMMSRRRRADERARQMRHDSKRAQSTPAEVLAALRPNK